MVDGIAIEDELDGALQAERERTEARNKRRASRRRPSFNIDKQEVVESVIKRFNADMDARQPWMEMRLQRYAKYRGWLSDKNWPWDNCANYHLPIMMIDSQRTQDTLHNAVMAIRPPIRSKATKRKDVQKQETVDNLIDHQVFVEQPGEETIGHLIDKYVNDGRFTSFTRWVREARTVHDVQIFPPLNDAEDDGAQLQAIVQNKIFNNLVDAVPKDEFGYDWNVDFNDEQGEMQNGKVGFYFRENGQVEAHVSMPAEVFNGPLIIAKSIEDVVAPWRSGNLQPPGPSNPHGAPHVFLVDYPRLDEIRRLKKSREYDRLSQEDLDGLESMQPNVQDGEQNNEPKKQKDELEGTEPSTPGTGKSVFTRIMAFDRWDVDGDGLEEDVIFWVLKEPKLLLRARLLTEIFPSNPPRRPLDEAQFIPVAEDRLYGISMLELLESLYDMEVTFVNQMVDNGTISTVPFGFYEPGSGMKAEIINVSPGELYPQRDPRNTIHYPNLPNAGQSLWFNAIALAEQFRERTTMQGDINFGRIPTGKSAALRTATTTQALLNQSDARPERILRRLFIGLSGIWRQIHELNQRFLPEGKEFRVTGYIKEGEDPYRTIEDTDILKGQFDFDFQAALLNTAPEAVQQSLMVLGASMMSPLFFSLNLIDKEKVYNWAHDLYKSAKLDPTRYLLDPVPDFDLPKLMAEEVITEIMSGNLPDVQPVEPPEVHLQKLIQFAQSDQMGLLDPDKVALLRAYMQRIREMIVQARQQQAIADGMAKLQAAMQGGGGPPGAAPAGIGIGTNAPQNNNELFDESLPSAGGGANGAGL